MKKVTTLILGLLAITIIYDGCSIVPLTGRRQMNMFPESEMVGMGLTSYQEFMKENPVSKDRNTTAMVKEIGNNIAQAVTKYMTENNLQDRLAGYQWEFNLIDDKVANAWCMPGGKVVVYTGILPITQDANGLAVVMSHEIAHAVARHGNERMSQQMLVQFGAVALSEAVSQKPEETQNLFMMAYGAGSQLGVMLPYSRDHELEADKMGLIFMAMAGYNPESAVAFWERMEAAGGAKPPEFLSTHPADKTRINKIKAALPEAMQYYNK